jgi:two-component system, NarL family, sensor histidine kinase UhpB
LWWLQGRFCTCICSANLIAENIREVFYLNDAQKPKTLYISPAYADVWGRSCESLYQNPRSFLDAIHPDDRQQVIASFEQQRRGEQVNVTYRVVHPDNTVRWVRSRAFPVRDENGSIHRVAGFAEDITDQVRYESQLKRLSQRLVTVLDTERARIARELHDQIGQQLTGLSLNLAVVQAQCGEAHPAYAVLDDSTELISGIIERVRLIIADLRPLVLDDMGLVAGLRWYCEKFTRRTGIRVVLEGAWDTLTGSTEHNATVNNTLYQIAQEALTNIAKHAHASHAWIDLSIDHNQLTMTVRDNGKGFDPQPVMEGSTAGSWGIQIMQERMRALVGSNLRIESEHGKGSRIIAEVQL